MMPCTMPTPKYANWFFFSYILAKGRSVKMAGKFIECHCRHRHHRRRVVSIELRTFRRFQTKFLLQFQFDCGGLSAEYSPVKWVRNKKDETKYFIIRSSTTMTTTTTTSTAKTKHSSEQNRFGNCLRAPNKTFPVVKHAEFSSIFVHATHTDRPTESSVCHLPFGLVWFLDFEQW